MSEETPPPVTVPGGSRPGTRARAGLVLAAIFVAGALCGAAGSVLAVRRAVLRRVEGRGFLETRMFDRMVRGLDLDAVQQERIRAILSDSRREMLDLADRVEPQAREILGRARQRIRSELRPDQQRRFDREVRQRIERYERFRKRLGGLP